MHLKMPTPSVYSNWENNDIKHYWIYSNTLCLGSWKFKVWSFSQEIEKELVFLVNFLLLKVLDFLISGRLIFAKANLWYAFLHAKMTFYDINTKNRSTLDI